MWSPELVNNGWIGHKRLTMDPLDNRGIGKSLLHRYCHREWKLLPSLTHIDPFWDLPSTPPHPPLLSPSSSSSFSIHPLLLSFFPNRLRSQDSFFSRRGFFLPYWQAFLFPPFSFAPLLFRLLLLFRTIPGLSDVLREIAADYKSGSQSKIIFSDLF